MFDFISFITGLVILGGAVYAFSKTKDPFHPAIVMAPVFLYGYSVWPLILNMGDGLARYFTPEELEYVAMLYCLAIACLYAGLLKLPHNLRPLRSPKLNFFHLSISPTLRKKVFQISIWLGVVAVSAYWYMIFNVGGFVNAYSRVKGGGWSSSGYIGEATLLSFPAVILLAIARQGARRIRWSDMALVALMVSPHLLQGTFGGRRGPLFLGLAVLFLAWYVAKGVRPSFTKIWVGIAMISCCVLLVWSQRQTVYLGSAGEFEGSRIVAMIKPEEISQGNEFVVGAATVLTADYFGDYYWGYRYFVTFVIRPIPKQLWPTKYDDMGANWVYRAGGDTSFSRYSQAVGFEPLAGSSTGSIADLYLEFSWGALIVCYLLGRAFAAVWRRHKTQGGLWTILFLEMLILSVYLPTQSLSAWLHRFLIMAAVSVLVWKYCIEGKPRLPRTALRARGTGRTP